MHVIDENGPSTLCVPSDRSMKPALSSGLTPGEGCAEVCGTEEHMGENREGCRVDESVRVAVEAGDIPSATDMGSALGRSSEPRTLAGVPRNKAGNLGRAHGAVCGPVRHSVRLPFSPTPAPTRVASGDSSIDGCSGQMDPEEAVMAGAGVAPRAEFLAEPCEVTEVVVGGCGTGAPTTAVVPATALSDAPGRYDMVPAKDRGGPGTSSAAEPEPSSPTGSSAEGEKPPARHLRRPRRAGDLVPHARFLQAVFRRTTSRWPGCWTAGGLAGKLWWRPVARFACRGGANLASFEAFTAQADLAARANGWYRHYVSLLRRLNSGHTPVAVVAFCGQGGLAEGIRRSGGAAHGLDRVAQPEYCRRFGRETFSEGDPTSISELSDLRRRTKAFVTIASPPSNARGSARGVDLGSTVRDACEGMGGLYVLEKTQADERGVRNSLCQLRGAYFGLRVDQPRSFEANFGLRVDEALVGPGLALRRGTCLGVRRIGDAGPVWIRLVVPPPQSVAKGTSGRFKAMHRRGAR